MLLAKILKMKPLIADQNSSDTPQNAWLYQLLWVKLLAFILALQFYAFKAHAQELPTVTGYQGAQASQFQVGGYVMLDYDQYGAFHNKKDSQSEDHLEVRRSKIGIKVFPKEAVSAELEFTYHNEYQQEEEFEVADAYITYTSQNDWSAQFGKMKEPFGLERQTGSTSITGIERSMVTTAFSPGRNIGAMLKFSEPHYSIALGVFEEDAPQSPQAITSRATYGFIQSEQATKHIGVSMSFRDLKDQEFQIKERGESNSADNIIRSAKFDAQSQQVIQLESAWITKKLRLQSEVSLSSIKQINGEDWLYSGFYLQASYLLNKGGSGAKYRYKNNKIKTKTKKGTWELVARYSGLDLQDNNIGSEASLLMFGVNHYINNQFRIMANILLPEISGNTVDDDQSGNGVSVRAQYTF